MVPEVHKNTFQFMNRPKPNEKVLTHIQNGVFSMLTSNAYLQSWSMKSSKEVTRKRKIDLPIKEGVELKDFYLSKTGDEQQSYDEYSIQLIELIDKNMKNHISAHIEPDVIQADKDKKAIRLFEEHEKNRIVFPEMEAEKSHFMILRMFEAGEKDNDKEIKVEIEAQFYFQSQECLKGSNYSQDMIISLNLKRLVQVRDHNFCTVYEKQPYAGKALAGSNWCTWHPVHRIDNIPRTLHEITKLSHFMFTDNFDYYLTFNYSSQQFVIKDVEKQEVHAVIPEKLFNCKSLGMKQAKAQVGLKAKQIQLLSDREVFINNYDGLLYKYDYIEGKVKGHYPEQAGCKFDRKAKYHSIVDFENYFSPNTMQNLIDRSNRFKIAQTGKQVIEDKLVNARRYGEKDKEFKTIARQYQKEMDKEMMNLYRDNSGNYRVEATFTIYDWLKIEQIMETVGTVAGQVKMNNYEMTRIAFNILPG